MKKIFILIVAALIIGSAIGIYFGNNPGGLKKVSEVKNLAINTVSSGQNTAKRNIALQKLDLLRIYTDFVLLPEEKIVDPDKYVSQMGEILKSIGDNEITAKFYATGEGDNKEQKIVDFLNQLNESIKADLN